ncbi:unnamed protein product [Ectocarpus fasciculatus]
MEFLKNTLKLNNIGATEAISTLASGESLVDAGKNLGKRVMALKFEKLLMNAADSYVAGYSTHNRALLGVAGRSAGVSVSLWGAIKGWKYYNESLDEDERYTGPMNAQGAEGVIAFVVFALVFLLINMYRRQNTFSVLAGTNMVNQYVKFFSVPFAVFFVAFRVMIPSDVAPSHMIMALAAGLASAVLFAVKKFYFVYKLNDIEKDVCTNISSIFDACSGNNNCTHEHAGFMNVFKWMNPGYIREMKRIFGELDFAEISRELSKSQIYDNKLF